jgi:hypothetical protein
MVLLDGELQIPHFVRDDNTFQVASGVVCRDPRGLKPASLLALGGTLRLRSGQALEALPFPFVEEGRSFRSASLKIKCETRVVQRAETGRAPSLLEFFVFRRFAVCLKAYPDTRHAPSKHSQNPSFSAACGAAALHKELLVKYPSHGGLRGTGEDARRSIMRLGA